MKLCARCERAAKGLCIECGEPAEDGKRMCREHLERHCKYVVSSRKRVQEREAKELALARSA